jgi:tRNA A37 methylthiotransferase MiaB
MKTACVVFIYGCPRSMMDASKLIAYLKRNGWNVIDNYRKADLILLGACGFNSTSEDKSLNFLSITCKKKKRDAQVVVFGCLSGINKEGINAHNDTKAISMNKTSRLDDLIGATYKYNDIEDQNTINKIVYDGINYYSKFDKALVNVKLSSRYFGKALLSTFYNKPHPLHDNYNHIFNIKIAKGCNAKCTYCAIRRASGPFISKPLDQILSEFTPALKEGYTNFRLVADDVGGYGQDNGSNIVDLLTQIFAAPGKFKLIWDDFNPNWLIKYFPALFEVFSKNIERFGYLGFPVQSGSEKILQLMNREYQAAEAKKCLLALRRAFPEIGISTHIIVGFPGETKEDFKETLSFLKEVKFNHFYAYKYCDRPNTIASQLPGKLNGITKYYRLLQLKREFKEACSVG